MSRCTGHCCSAFPMPVSPEELFDPERSFDDGEKIKDMVTHLGLLYVQDPVSGESHSMHHYSCKHFDGKDCTIYEDRPGMCRRYPHTGICDHAGKGCTADFVELKRRVDGDLVK